jgi:hypothetical protein
MFNDEGCQFKTQSLHCCAVTVPLTQACCEGNVTLFVGKSSLVKSLFQNQRRYRAL